MPPRLTVYKNIYENNKNHLEEIALLFFGKKITYSELFEDIERAAKSFVAFGITENDNVAICMPAVPEIVISILALNKIGANAALLNPTFTTQQLTDRINETEATLLITINECYQNIESAIPNTFIENVICFPAVNYLGPLVKFLTKAKKIKGTISWKTFISAGEKTIASESEYDPDRSAIMVFSSGSTGASKGIQLRNTGINASINDGAHIGFDWKRQEKWIAPIPVWFSTGIVASILVPLCHGITVILEPKYDFNVFRSHIHKHHPNYIITAAAPVSHLVTEKNDDFKYFKYFVVGGEYVTPTADKRFSEILLESGAPYGLFKGYGMCECGGTVTASNYRSNMVGSAGIPLPHVTISAFDLANGNELKYGERGEIRVNTPCRMKEYFKKPDETEKYFYTDENGQIWCCTGDMGYVTEDGSVFVCGRISDSYINSNNQKIYLFDIERAALDVPVVKQCKAVSSIINNREVHICHIVLDSKDDIESSLRLVQKHCKEILPATHIPNLFKLYDDALPVAPNGKLDLQSMKNDTLDLITI